MAVVIQRREGSKPFRVVDGEERLTGWCSTWGHVQGVAADHGWTGEIVDVSGDQAADEVLKTRGGYALDEVVSALQKEIRRGNEWQACYWARELAASGMWRYCWRRLGVIAAEDVGFASPETVVLVESLRSGYAWAAETSKRQPGWEQRMCMAVVALARAPKSREIDDLCWTVDRERDVPVPDYAVDMHTRRGRQMGRGIEFFVAESGRLVNEAYPSRYAGEQWTEDY